MSDQNDNPDKKPPADKTAQEKPQADNPVSDVPTADKPQARPVTVTGASPQRPSAPQRSQMSQTNKPKPQQSAQAQGGQNQSRKTPPNNRPNKKKPPTRKRPVKKNINPTQQSLIGIFVFAIGVALTVAVLYLAYTKFYKPTSGGADAPTQASSQLKDGAAEANNREAVKDIDKASLNNMVGQWSARYGYLTAYLTVTDKNLFQITLFMDPDGFERRYTSGSVTYDDHEGLLTMQPSYERWPEPEVGVLKTLTRNKFSVVTLFSKKDGSLIWVPYEGDIGSANIHPLFKHMQRDEGFIRWTKMKK